MHHHVNEIAEMGEYPLITIADIDPARILGFSFKVNVPLLAVLAEIEIPCSHINVHIFSIIRFAPISTIPMPQHIV